MGWLSYARFSLPTGHTLPHFSSTLFVSNPSPSWSRVTSCVVTQRAVTSSLARVLIPYLPTPRRIPLCTPASLSPAPLLSPHGRYSHGSIYPAFIAQRKHKHEHKHNTIPPAANKPNQRNTMIQNTEMLNLSTFFFLTRTISLTSFQSPDRPNILT